jgi:hypothetical protein
MRPGASVRLLDHAHLGQVGQVRTMSSAPRRLPSRVRVTAVEVALEDGEVLLLPRNDVEALN